MPNPDDSSNAVSGKSKPRNKPRKKSSKADPKKQSAQRVVVSAEQLPRKSLEQSLRIARTLRETFAGGPAAWDEIAQAMQMANNSMNKYYLWSAQAYGLVQKDDEKFSLTEIGRKLIAPTAPNEDKEAAIQITMAIRFQSLNTSAMYSKFDMACRESESRRRVA